MPLAWAQMAELVDALASGASIRKDVEVRVLFWAPFIQSLLFIQSCSNQAILVLSMHYCPSMFGDAILQSQSFGGRSRGILK